MNNEDSVPAIATTSPECLRSTSAERRTPHAHDAKNNTSDAAVTRSHDHELLLETSSLFVAGLRPDATSRPCSTARGGGGFPGTSRSTGRTDATPPADIKTPSKNSSGGCTASNRHDPLRVGHCLVGFQQRFSHVFTDRADDEQQVGRAWRGRKEQSEAVHVVKRVIRAASLREGRLRSRRRRPPSHSGTWQKQCGKPR